MPPAPVVVSRSGDGAAGWELAEARPVTPAVRRYCGYVEHGEPVRRLEVPGAQVSVIISFGDTLDVATLAGRPERHRSFVAGFSDEAGVTHHDGHQHGIQFDLSPLAAYRLLGGSVRELAGGPSSRGSGEAGVVALEDLGTRPFAGLVDRLAHLPDWPERFALLDEVLPRWMDDGPPVDPAVAWAWNRLVASHGRVTVGDLAAEIGWSRRHFVARFGQQVGLPPKRAARVLRFQHATGLLAGAAGARTISQVAADAGYADHSHLVREFRALTGTTPSAWAAEGPASLAG